MPRHNDPRPGGPDDPAWKDKERKQDPRGCWFAVAVGFVALRGAITLYKFHAAFLATLAPPTFHIQ